MTNYLLLLWLAASTVVPYKAKTIRLVPKRLVEPSITINGEGKDLLVFNNPLSKRVTAKIACFSEYEPFSITAEPKSKVFLDVVYEDGEPLSSTAQFMCYIVNYTTQ